MSPLLIVVMPPIGHTTCSGTAIEAVLQCSKSNWGYNNHVAAPAPAAIPPITEQYLRLPRVKPSRRAFLGFLLIGTLISIPATALPAWDYHLQPPFLAIGLHFLSLAFGVFLTLRLGAFVLRRFSTHQVFLFGLAVASAALLALEFCAPPQPIGWRHGAFFLIGIAMGSLMGATFQMLQPLYEQNPAATVNLAGGFLGLGALLPALIGALAYVWTEFRGLYIVLALVPAALCFTLRPNGTGTKSPAAGETLGAMLREIQSPMHVLFALLLFFETAAELSVAQWTGLHLILRSGMAPSTALYFLCFYCLCLLGGRFLAQAMLAQFSHRRLLLASAAMSWLGLTIFSTTLNATGAVLGLSLSALGFSFVYPLLVERIGSRFREYHSNLFHGIFGLGMLGGFLAPAVIGFWAAWGGESTAMTVPLWCSLLVFLLLLLLWVESKISASRVPRS
jgi:fucose permease